MNTENRYYIVLDLEMCQVPKAKKTKEYHYKNEIIQIGAVKLNKDFAEVSRFSTFVKPQFGYVDSFIEELTGISQQNVENAPVFEDAIREFLNWVDDENAVMVSWSRSDLKQFKIEINGKGITTGELDRYFDSWIDCQELFGIATNASASWGLERAIFAANIVAEGHMHDGLADAVNTASLFRLIKTQPDFKLIDIYESLRHEEVEHLSFSMGSLFEGLNLQFA